MTPLRWRNLCIRAAIPEDASLLARWWNDGAVMAHAGFPFGLGRSAEQIAADLETDSDERRRRMILELDGVSVGECSYTIAGDAAEIGIKLCEARYQNQGYGRRYLSLLIDHLLRERGLRRILLDTDPANARARHVYESLGFRLTGIRRACWKDKLGADRDAADYELLPGNFRDWRLIGECAAAALDHPDKAGSGDLGGVEPLKRT